MNPSKVLRDEVVLLTHLPNIGPSLANDLKLIGINKAHRPRYAPC